MWRGFPVTKTAFSEAHIFVAFTRTDSIRYSSHTLSY